MDTTTQKTPDQRLAQPVVVSSDWFYGFGTEVNWLLCKRGATGISAQEIEDLAKSSLGSRLAALDTQNKSMRARLQGIAAQIEDSQYYGKISPRGAPKMLNEIADACHNTLETCAGVAGRALQNAPHEPRAEDQSHG